MDRTLPDGTRPLLTPMMRGILALHASGMTLRQASGELYITYSGVAGTVQEIKRRLGARTLAACVIRAHALGYISSPDAEGMVVPLLPAGMIDPARGG